MELGIFGHGYSAQAISALCAPQMRIWATRQQVGEGVVAYDAGQPADQLLPMARSTTHVLISIPPIDDEGSVCKVLIPFLSALPDLCWVGYLSTTGVYGDAEGAWVNESAPLRATNARALARVVEEQALVASGLPVHIFRVAGIYGPGRSAIEQLRAGKARRIDKPEHVFSRIHVHDLARIVHASLLNPAPGVVNLADDLPCPAHEVVAYGAMLLNMPPPPLEPYADAAASLSPMLREFYEATRRVSNKKAKALLGGALSYPSYREGLKACLKAVCEPQPA